MKKIVVLGGGTGLSVLLRGLKQFPLDITAIVTVADDGSSSGRLREEFDIFAVGDLRNVLVSLSEVEPLIEDLLQYRFVTDSSLNNHPMGNLLLTALYNITGNLTESLRSLSKIFNIKGTILPFTEENPVLIAHTTDGKIIEGESNITKAGKEIDYIEYKNEVKPTKEVIKAIDEADLIIFGIGSLYTSIIPNLLSKEVVESLKNSKAKKMYVCNIMSEHGETDNYKVSDCIKKINSYVKEDLMDVVVVNNKKVPDDIKERYLGETAGQIDIDYDVLNDMNVEIIEDELLYISEKKKVRHDPYMVAESAIKLICNDLKYEDREDDPEYVMLNAKLKSDKRINKIKKMQAKMEKKEQGKQQDKNKKSVRKSKFNSKYSDRIQSIRESDEKFRRNHQK